VLLLDGHSSHTKNVEALKMVRENGVILLAVPGHTVHKLQPLDLAFFKPLSCYHTEVMKQWLCRPENVGKCVTQFQVAQLFGKAYGKVATVAMTVSSFASMGVWPVDCDIFQEHNFSSSVALQVIGENVPTVSNEALVTSPLPSTSRSDFESQTLELNFKGCHISNKAKKNSGNPKSCSAY
jgi:hypothetical protein